MPSDLILHQDDFLYRSFKYLDPEDELDWKEFYAKVANLPDQEIQKGVSNFIKMLLDNSYAGIEESVTAFYTLDISNNKFNELSEREILNIIDFNYIIERIREESKRLNQ